MDKLLERFDNLENEVLTLKKTNAELTIKINDLEIKIINLNNRVSYLELDNRYILERAHELIYKLTINENLSNQSQEQTA